MTKDCAAAASIARKSRHSLLALCSPCVATCARLRWTASILFSLCAYSVRCLMCSLTPSQINILVIKRISLIFRQIFPNMF